jgi:sulfopyruvate decarboxylase alpha subunit
MGEGQLVTRSETAAWAERVCAGIRSADCRWVVYVPDNPLSQVLRVLARDYPDASTLVATREEEAFGVASGLYLGGCRSTVMLQSSGVGNSLNAMGSLLVAYHIPVLILVSMRGGPGEWNEAQVPVGRAVPLFFDALGIQYTKAEAVSGAEEAVQHAARLAFGTRTPAACLLTRSLTAASIKPEARRLTPAYDYSASNSTAPGAHEPERHKQGSRPLMSRLDATRLLAGRLRDEAVIATLGHPSYDLFAVRDRAANFYTWGSMGMASSIGLGLALARPDQRVVVIDGDGSLLMNLGSLATIGVTRPPNLTLVVWDNGEYGTTGGQRSATGAGADLASAARALGITAATTVRTPGELDAALDAGGAGGPAIIVAKVGESAPIAKPPLDCVFLKQRFMEAIGSPEAAVRGGPA